LEGTGKACVAFGVWMSSATSQAIKLERGLGQDVEVSGGCRKCQRGPETSFSLPTVVLKKISLLPAGWIQKSGTPASQRVANSTSCMDLHWRVIRVILPYWVLRYLQDEAASAVGKRKGCSWAGRTGLLTFEQSRRDEWSKTQLLLQEGINPSC